jgi:hypothetical protein
LATKRKGTDSSTSATESKFTGLRRFNLVMGFLHLVQGVFMILVSNDTTYPILTNYLNFDLATRSLKPGLSFSMSFLSAQRLRSSCSSRLWRTSICQPSGTVGFAAVAASKQ